MKRFWTLFLLLPACGSDSPAEVTGFRAEQTRVNAVAGVDNSEFCCGGDAVYVAWQDDRNDPGGNNDILLNYSSDGGRTFQPADVLVNTNGPGVSASENPRICCSGQRVYVIWEDRRDGAADPYLNYSMDGGATWQANDIRLSTNAPGASESVDLRICCDGLNVYVVWRDDRTGGDSKGIWTNVSTDGGATWFANDVRVDQGLSVDAEGPRLCCEGGTVHVAWRDDDAETIIYTSRSTDAGQTWATETRLNMVSDASGPEICCDGSYVHVVWPNDGDTDLYASSSTDGGVTWSATETRLNTNAAGSAELRSPNVCCGGANVYVAWQDRREAGRNNAYLNRSLDGGATWEASDVQIDEDPLNGSNDPQLCCDGLTVYAAWKDDRFDPEESVFFQHSLDGGLTWQPADLRIDTDALVAELGDVRMCCDGAVAYLMWTEEGVISLNRGRP